MPVPIYVTPGMTQGQSVEGGFVQYAYDAQVPAAGLQRLTIRLRMDDHKADQALSSVKAKVNELIDTVNNL